MDHLCLLPNDAARRRALNTLPPTLNATYERILQRINKSNKEVQQLVQRSLRWLLCSKEPLSSLALCEAISIETGDTTLDRTAVPDESEIFRWCSSLVRRSASGKSLELGHFTVKEFLTTGTDLLDSEYGVYRFSPEIDDAELAETCLTYLSFENFGSGSRDSTYFSYKRWENFEFRHYAVRHWANHARKNLNRPEVMSLTQQLLHPSKPLTFVSWTQDFLWSYYGYKHGIFQNNSQVPKYDLTTTNPLHLAAMLALSESCEWLLQEGCYVDQASTYGTPLECALLGEAVMKPGSLLSPSDEFLVSRRSTVKLIIESGADVQKSCFPRPSFIYIALIMRDEVLCAELLRKGAAIDRISASLFAQRDMGLLAYKVLENIGQDNIRPEDHATLLEAALKSRAPIKHPLELLVHRSGDLIAAHTDYISPFLTAAEYGQLSVLKQLFHDHKLSVNIRGCQDQRSALHLAASNDRIDIVRFLQEHGADCTLADSQGRTPLHASVESPGGYLCLQFLLDQNVDVNTIDRNGLTAWHLAASQGNTHALSILKGFATPKKKFNPRLKANDGRTILHCAAQSGSEETMIFSLNHCDEDAVHSKSLDGSTALHYAMKAYSLDPDDSNISGLGVLEALLTRGADPMSQDSMGGTALSYLVETWEKYFLKYTDFTDVVEYDDVEEIAAMINKIVDSTKNKDCLTTVCKDPHLLFLALVFGEEDLAYKVLRHCPSVDEKAYRISKLSSLEAACCYGWCSRQLLEEVLRASKVDRSAASTKSGLLLCACEERPDNMGIRPYSMKEIVEDLLDLGFNPNDCSVEGRTAMMLAAKGGHEAIVELLIYHGADVAATDNRGWSVIHYACLSGNGRLLYSLKRVMSNWNARITTELHHGWFYNATALHLAAGLDGYALEFLLANDLISDINSLTHNKATALCIAAYFGSSRNVSLLLDENADDTIQTRHIESPLHVAIRCGHLEVVNIFINKGCDLLLQDGKGLTPELLARKYGHQDLANVLKEKTSARGKNESIRLDTTFNSLTST